MIKILKIAIGGSGIFFLLMFILSFTDVPYHAYYNLGTSFPIEENKPNVIVIMGGSGMPSPDGLIRTYYGAQLAHLYKEIPIIIALPKNDSDSSRQLNLMAYELISKGIDSSRIKFEPLGYNTRTQAVNIAKMYLDTIVDAKILIVTSPEHIYRSVKCFLNAGFSEVYGFPTFENPSNEESLKSKSKQKEINPTLNMRYNMWSYLNYELLVLREYMAIFYYKLNGWI